MEVCCGQEKSENMAEGRQTGPGTPSAVGSLAGLGTPSGVGTWSGVGTRSGVGTWSGVGKLPAVGSLPELVGDTLLAGSLPEPGTPVAAECWLLPHALLQLLAHF